jgi:GNAT superfamily N-acetyltransferase
VISVRAAEPGDVEVCVDVLASLPDYFTPNTHDEARSGLAEHQGWVAVDEGHLDGFILAEVRYQVAAEITFAAVRPERHGDGVGTQLLTAALDALRISGVELVEVKTLDASAGYEPYVATRAFWERRGFRQIDCIDPLPGWQPGNPSAIYVLALR